jgi:hypothetical protein
MSEHDEIISRERWRQFKDMMKNNLPEYEKKYVGKGKDSHFWKVILEKKFEQETYKIIAIITNKVMIHPKVDYESCFSKGTEKIKNVFMSRPENINFLGSVIIGEYNYKPLIRHEEGQEL